jgi:hypothetical protein
VSIDTGNRPLGRREGLLLATIGVLALLASAVSFYAGYRTTTPVVATTAIDDDGPRIPLPAGPRKYQ